MRLSRIGRGQLELGLAKLRDRLDERLGEIVGERLVSNILILLYNTAHCAKVKASIVSDHVVVNNNYNCLSPEDRCFKFLVPRAGHCLYQDWLGWTKKRY